MSWEKIFELLENMNRMNPKEEELYSQAKRVGKLIAQRLHEGDPVSNAEILTLFTHIGSCQVPGHVIQGITRK